MGLIGGIARTAVIAGTATAVSNRVSRYQAGRWAAEDQSKPQHGYLPPPAGRYVGRYQRPMFQPSYGQPGQVQPEPRADQGLVPGDHPGAVPAGEDMSAKLAQLQQLGELKAQGILTDAQFEAQKRKILGD